MGIQKIDTNGSKGLLGKAEFGFDDYSAGGDQGRVWVGNGLQNQAIAFKSEVDSVAAAANALTTLTINANVLQCTAEDGNTTDIDLSTYLDDTNLARIAGGTLAAGTGIATFSRDDGSTFTLDLSALLDDTVVTIVADLTSTDDTAALAASQGKILNDRINVTNTAVNSLDARVTALETVVEW